LRQKPRTRINQTKRGATIITFEYSLKSETNVTTTIDETQAKSQKTPEDARRSVIEGSEFDEPPNPPIASLPAKGLSPRNLEPRYLVSF
jgi:hypothetical protein